MLLMKLYPQSNIPKKWLKGSSLKVEVSPALAEVRNYLISPLAINSALCYNMGH